MMLLGAAIALVAALAGCSDAAPGDTGSEESTSEASTLPATLHAHDNSYIIESFELTVDEEGNTVVSCEGSGFDILPLKNNKMIIPVYCSVIEDGEEIEFASFATKSGKPDFIFKGKVEPETVVFYPEDNREARVSVSV